MNHNQNETNMRYVIHSLNYREKAEQVLPCFSGQFFEPCVLTTELGLLKYSLLKMVALSSPSMTLLIFDWQEENAIQDWSLVVGQIIAEIQFLRENCSSQTKIAVLVFLPNAEKDLPQGMVDERTTFLRKSVAQTEHAEMAKTFFLV